LFQLSDGIEIASVTGMRPGATLLFAAVLLGQDSAAKFPGTWEARFKGAVFCVLKIESGERLAGTMSAVDIDIDEEGNLTSAEAKDDVFPILLPSIENNHLRFEWSDDPSEEPLKFEFAITANGQAELTLLTTPEGAKIKPFKFTRRD
jgi:hypothetical protein